ncbi:MAG: hypothetical protein M3065_21865 [Actinomycetota bacterium]|nr:hypothetical protein [Actinomycetota bacterium]
MMRKMRPRSIAPSAAVVLVAIATGCGSSASSGSGLSHAALVTRVNAVCKHHSEIVTAAASKVLAGGKLPTPAVFGKLAHQTIIPQYAAMIGTLSVLKPASGGAAKYQAWLTLSRATLAKMQQNPGIIRSSANFNGVNAEARSLGFGTVCHIGPS